MARRRKVGNGTREVLGLAPPKGQRRQHGWLYSNPRSKQVHVGRVSYVYDPFEPRTSKMMTVRREAKWWRGLGFRARVIRVNSKTGRLMSKRPRRRRR